MEQNQRVAPPMLLFRIIAGRGCASSATYVWDARLRRGWRYSGGCMHSIQHFSVAAVLGAILIVPEPLAAEGPTVRVPQGKREPPAAGPRANAPAKMRLREGARLTDIRGRFEFAGERLIFYRADDNEALPPLENLALERISQMVQDSQTRLEWIVSGTITEYRGGNFLLVTKAVVRGAE
jgi:hypothetical protein